HASRGMGSLVRALALGLLASALVSCGVGPAATSPSPSAAAGDPLQLGLAAHTAGRLDEAVAYYFQALAKDPGNEFAYFNLGEIEHTRNHLAAADAWYRLALNSQKDMPQALYNLALVRQSLGDSNESASLLRRLIAIQPNNGSAHWNLGVALRSLGQTDAANAEFAAAQKLDARLTPPPVGGASPHPSPTR
ncbi:MAG TPA: tetratricopeptide repeat protein, partial [Candidatus Limnocylindria bacterium]